MNSGEIIVTILGLVLAVSYDLTSFRDLVAIALPFCANYLEVRHAVN